MIYPLSKPIRRQLGTTDRKGRPLVVTISPGDLLEFRPKGSRRSVSVTLGHCFNLARILTVNWEYQKALKAYQTDKAAGKRRRKPKRPALPFAPEYFQAAKLPI